MIMRLPNDAKRLGSLYIREYSDRIAACVGSTPTSRTIYVQFFNLFVFFVGCSRCET